MLISQYPFKIVLANQNKPVSEIFEFLYWLKQLEPEIIQIFIYTNDNYTSLDSISSNYSNLTDQNLGKPWNTKEMESILRKWWN